MMIGDRILISHFFERERFSVSNKLLGTFTYVSVGTYFADGKPLTNKTMT